MTHEEKIAKAKAKLIMENPFFASIICNMPVTADDTLKPPTMATNGKWVRYHPEFVDEHSLHEVLFVLCHEVGHCMFGHMFRRGQRDPKLWNIAGDYVINDMLVTDGVGTMPSNGLHNPGLVTAGGGTTDGVYDLLPKDQNGGAGAGLPDLFDECHDADGDEADRAQAEAEIKVQIAQAAAAAKMCGKMGAKLERLVDMALKPKVSWQDVLRRFVSARAKVEYTYARPKRRFLAEDLFLPSLGGNQLGELCIAVDCSGSINQDEINAFAAEISAIKEDCCPTKLHVIYFHHEVSRVDTFDRDDELVIRPNGTGGTAFSPIFREIDARDFDPCATIVLTDLECYDFGNPPSYPVLWVSTHRDSAPFGEVVMMK